MRNQYSPKALVLLVILIFGGFYSCCEDPTPLYFEPERIVSVHMQNEGAYPVIEPSNQIPAVAYVLQGLIKMGPKSFVDRKPSKSPGFQFGMAARADGCYDYVHINDHWVEGWDIYTVNDFDATHPAGSKISDYFELYSNRCMYTEMSSSDVAMQFALYATPEQIEQQFILDIYFNEGIVLRDTTEVVWLD